MGIRKVTVNMYSIEDNGDERYSLIFVVPEDVTDLDVRCALSDMNDKIYDNDELYDETYGKHGKTPFTLADCVCKEKGWQWEEMKFDIVMEFE